MEYEPPMPDLKEDAEDTPEKSKGRKEKAKTIMWPRLLRGERSGEEVPEPNSILERMARNLRRVFSFGETIKKEPVHTPVESSYEAEPETHYSNLSTESSELPLEAAPRAEKLDNEVPETITEKNPTVDKTEVSRPSKEEPEEEIQEIDLDETGNRSAVEHTVELSHQPEMQSETHAQPEQQQTERIIPPVEIPIAQVAAAHEAQTAHSMPYQERTGTVFMQDPEARGLAAVGLVGLGAEHIGRKRADRKVNKRVDKLNKEVKQGQERLEKVENTAERSKEDLTQHQIWQRAFESRPAPKPVVEAKGPAPSSSPERSTVRPALTPERPTVMPGSSETVKEKAFVSPAEKQPKQQLEQFKPEAMISREVLCERQY